MGNFGIKHLGGLAWLLPLVAALLVATLLYRKSRKDPDRYDRHVILAASAFIWLWEFIKTVYIFNSPAYAGVGLYTAYMLPFHICSMGLYAFPVVASRHERLARFVKPFAFAVMIIVTSIILVVPDFAGILGNRTDWAFVPDNILPYQSFLYHGTLLFVPLYMVISGFYRPRIADVGKATVVLLVTAAFAFMMNKLLGVTDFMTLEYGWGNPFNYLIPDRYLLYVLILMAVGVGGAAVALGFGELADRLLRKPR